MELGWGALALIIVGAAAAWLWQDSLAARERANAAAMRACLDMGLQFLDGTVAFARMSFARSAGGLLAMRRTYVFDYTADSIERRQGFVVLLGHTIESVGYAPDTRPPRAAEPIPPPVSEVPPEPPRTDRKAANKDGKPQVLWLDDWRARRRKSGGRAPQWREDRDDRIK